MPSKLQCSNACVRERCGMGTRAKPAHQSWQQSTPKVGCHPPAPLPSPPARSYTAQRSPMRLRAPFGLRRTAGDV
eukprot:364891-Chlamydomonas_euryale.AAC.7